jgi:hypothetical protein
VWRELDLHFGPVARAADRIAKAFPGEKGCNEYQAFLRLAEELAVVYRNWRKKVENGNTQPE